MRACIGWSGKSSMKSLTGGFALATTATEIHKDLQTSGSENRRYSYTQIYLRSLGLLHLKPHTQQVPTNANSRTQKRQACRGDGRAVALPLQLAWDESQHLGFLGTESWNVCKTAADQSAASDLWENLHILCAQLYHFSFLKEANYLSFASKNSPFHVAPKATTKVSSALRARAAHGKEPHWALQA